MTCEAWLVDLGLIDYDAALDLQLSALKARADGLIPDTLLLLEHPAVITLGRSADRSHVLLSPEELEARNVSVHETGRGGDVTLHAPGQLVGYPIIDLSARGRDVHRYLRDLEQVLIASLAAWGIEAGRVPGLTGVWVSGSGLTVQGSGLRAQGTILPTVHSEPCPLSPEPNTHRKVAAIGIGVKRWTTYHGFALNVNLDLALFDMIVPCGLHDHGITSVSQLLGRPISMEEAASRVAAAWPAVFPAHLTETPVQRWLSAIRVDSSSVITTSRNTCTKVGSH